MLPVLAKDDLHAFWHDSIAYQARPRLAVLDLGPVGRAGLRAAAGPGRGRGAGAARWRSCPAGATWSRSQRWAAAILIALQLGITHWFYLYIVWFFPLVMVALLGCLPGAGGRADDGS